MDKKSGQAPSQFSDIEQMMFRIGQIEYICRSSRQKSYHKHILVF